MEFIKPSRSGIILKVKVQPKAHRTELAGLHGDCLRIRIDAPPTDNAANQALIEFIAELLHCPKNNVQIIHGAKSTVKTLSVSGVTPDQAASIFGSLINST